VTLRAWAIDAAMARKRIRAARPITAKVANARTRCAVGLGRVSPLRSQIPRGAAPGCERRAFQGRDPARVAALPSQWVGVEAAAVE